jgi:DASS family divalent anion:Na+ symporter
MGAALLSHIPPRRYKLLTFILFGSGFVATPLLPLGRARAVLLGTFNKSIFHTTGFKPCSNGSAGLGLSTFLASGQMSFMFLTGAAYGLAGWSLLPQSAKAEFGWLSWLIAALPAGIFSFLFLFAATHFVFPLTEEDRTHIANRFNGKQTETARPWSRNEWLSLVVVILSIVAWLSKPLHGIDESWVALAGMVAFLTSGVLDKKGFSSIDWGFLFFFAIVSSLGNIAMYLSVDKWLVSIMNPVFALFSFHPLPFLLVIVLVAFVVRLFLKKITAAVVSTIVLIPWATVMDIHPGVILLAILIGMESWFLPYQDDSYQLVYNTTEGRSFSHAQARKIMIAKFVSAFLAIGLSYPYWKALGYIN